MNRSWGSPPRVREPLRGILSGLLRVGITPACAGTTHTLSLKVLARQDHPRVCGNHLLYSRIHVSSLGSPPRVREPLGAFFARKNKVRITPACAGTTSRTSSGTLTMWDHPSVCGNHLIIHGFVLTCRGSPPRVREPLKKLGGVSYKFGITPACAGTTGRPAPPGSHHWDHPRVCGNHLACCCTSSCA